MADAGYSKDCILLHKMIREGFTLPHRDGDSYLDRVFKNKMNDIVLSDKPYNYRWNGKNYLGHTCWSRISPCLIKINQLRQRNWYWKPLIV